MGRGRIFEIDPEHPKPRLIMQAAEVLKAGGIIAHPTDTTYALGVALHNTKGVDELYRIKKKDLKRPLSFLCRDISNLSEYSNVSKSAFQIMKRILPGPYTIILPARKSAPRNLLWTNRKEIGIRVPDNKIVQALVDELGEPFISTSAKVHGGDLLSSAQDIQQEFGYALELILDAGDIFPVPSTIISFVDQKPEIIRQGKGSTEDIIELEQAE